MRKILAMTVAATFLLSSVVYAADVATVTSKGVDVVAAASEAAPAPAPAPKPTPKPAPKPATPAPKPTTPAPKPVTPAPVVAPKPVTPAPVVAPKPVVDVVTTASLVNTTAAFEKAISEDGRWIITTLKDITTDKDLVLDGVFKNGKKDKVTGIDAIQRKIGLYTQDDKHVVTARFSLTAPSLTINSPFASIEHGTFNGDIYVRAINFKLVDQKVNGNVIFTTQAAKDTFTMDATSSINGNQILADVDAIATASIVRDAAAFEKAINNNWIVATLSDLVIDKPLTVQGEFHDKNVATNKIYHKIGFYTHNNPASKAIATHSFSLTIPSLTIKSPGTSLQYGTLNGDVIVYAPNFNLLNITVNGNIIFATQEAKNTFTMTNSTINGKQILADVDAVTTASIVDNVAAFEKAISKDGNWIAATLRDLTTDKELVLEGDFKNGTTVARKIALYTQDEKRATTRKFTVTAPKLTIKSPNANITKGTFKGDVYVTTPNFKLVDAIVDGDIYFTTKEAMTSFTMDATSKITGNKIFTTQVDAVASASVVNTNAAFEKSISAEGTWIPAILRDMYFTKELVVDGTFHDKGDATKDLKRKLALYTQDDKHVVTNSFILSAPKLTIKSPNANISNGIFKGDIYVSAPNFQLIGTKVEGNIYFTSAAFVQTFKMDAKSSVTGTFAIK